MGNPAPQRRGAFFQNLSGGDPFSNHPWWILLRWLLVAVAIGVTLIGNQLVHLKIPSLAIFSLCSVLILLNALLHYYVIGTRKKATHLDSALADRFTYVQLAIDWVFLTLLFHYTGGIASPLLFYFLFHVVVGGVVLKGWMCLLYSTLIAVTFALLSLMELGGLIPHLSSSSFISEEIQKNPLFVTFAVFMFTVVLYLSISFLTLLIGRLRERVLVLTGIQHKIEQTNRELRFLNQLYRGLSTTLGLHQRLEYICKSIVELMGIKGAAIRLMDERTNRLELASAVGLSEAYLNKGPVDADKSLAKALEGEPHFVLDASTDPAVQYPEEARKAGIVSMLALPLKGRQRVIGTLRLYTGERRHFSQHEVNFISALSSQAAIFIENAQIQDFLEKQDEAKSEFIMAMTHELKGPFMAIQGMLEVMLQGYVGELTERQRELIDRIYKRIDSVMEVSTGLLDIYEWQSRKLDVKRAPLSAKEQIQKATDLFRAHAGQKGLSLAANVPDDDVVLMGTEEELEKVLNNLITNAIKYTPSGGSIVLNIEAAENRVIIRMRDTGIGIAKGDIPRIFEESFRTHEAKKIDPYGKGLGLPFIKRVVDALEGTIEVKSRKGKGTEFILTFPRA